MAFMIHTLSNGRRDSLQTILADLSDHLELSPQAYINRRLRTADYAESWSEESCVEPLGILNFAAEHLPALEQLREKWANFATWGTDFRDASERLPEKAMYFDVQLADFHLGSEWTPENPGAFEIQQVDLLEVPERMSAESFHLEYEAVDLWDTAECSPDPATKIRQFLGSILSRNVGRQHGRILVRIDLGADRTPRPCRDSRVPARGSRSGCKRQARRNLPRPSCGDRRLLHLRL